MAGLTVISADATISPASNTTSMVSLRNSLSLSVRFISFPFQFEVWLRCGNLCANHGNRLAYRFPLIIDTPCGDEANMRARILSYHYCRRA